MFLPTLLPSTSQHGGGQAAPRMLLRGGWVGQRPACCAQAHWLPFLTSLSLFSCLGPPGRRGKPGRRGDPGESQVFLFPQPRPGSLPWARDLAGSARAGTTPLVRILDPGSDLPLPSNYSHCPRRPQAQCPVLLFLDFLTSQFQKLSPLCPWHPPNLIIILRNFSP